MVTPMVNDREVLQELLRHDFASFVAQVFSTVDGSQKFLPNWHVEVMADWLTLAASGKLNRLIITLPPRYLKSICASVALPAWILGHDPTARIICVSYSDELAAKLARDCRKVMESVWYKWLFPKTRLSRHKKAANDFETTQGGGRFSTSVGGTLTGRGGNWIIVDDPSKPSEALSVARRNSVNQWFDNTIYSRLDNKETGVIIIIMQRVHQDDLVGHVKEKGHWEENCLPAIADFDEEFTIGDGHTVGRKAGEALHPERESLEKLEQVKQDIGGYNFEAQYQQSPVPEGGNLIKWDGFQYYDELPQPGNGSGRVTQSWDTAVSVSNNADWSVCTTWAIRGELFYLIDVFRQRLDFPSLKSKIVELKNQYDAHDVLIEDAGAAIGLIQQLKAEGKIYPIGIKPDGSKEDRMVAQSAVIEAKRVYIPNTASWLEDFRAEIVAFPSGKNDDQVDSLSQFLNWKLNRRDGIRIVHVRA